MNSLVTIFVFFLVAFLSGIFSIDSGLKFHTSIMVEICDNGIDDDMDGFIDINDDDCDCPPIIPSGLIPNPSFEFQSCCPMVKARLDCADSWIQASAATTDYLHTCGFLGNVIDMPLPVPDGAGAIGLRDGSFDNGNFKEYAGACLVQNIVAGKAYRLRLNVGFRNATTSPPFTLSIFGNSECNALPFGNGNSSIGCPSNVSGWVVLGSVAVTGLEQWVEAEINFQTDQDIGAVAIGPDCNIRATGVDRYYFLDNLRLAETINFGYDVAITAGSPCQPNLELGLTGMKPGETYQWYRDGIAIIGATGTSYQVSDDASRVGAYQVFVQAQGACQLTTATSVVIENSILSIQEPVCANTVYQFGSQLITESGSYSETFLDVMGCDSTVNLELIFRPENTNRIDTTLCLGDSFRIGDEVFLTNGQFLRILPDQHGCDSTIELSLKVEDPLVSFNFSDEEISLGQEIELNLQGQEMNISTHTWSFGDIEICTDCSIASIVPLFDGIIVLNVIDNNNCIQQTSFQVLVSKDYKIFVPNAFSPNADGFNDIFRIYPNNALVGLNYFQIYDRWGSKLYNLENSLDVAWDGQFNGTQLNTGTYVYTMEAEFIDGHSEIISGTVHLLR